ncbi:MULTISPECIES: hypothetical protein [unclassified Lysinibacillus]|uniref:hypothetical protein n=1 Tax=unclassified Lysinibacillus TaxID=2636778 RepID=UPI002011BBF6|nr:MULTISPECIES: hypothetical protein [unclassified Lysinibacillus]MCL1696441.1 hypothetical protein [Lysinibacillus sp. BPa_S21]MCL1700372.1 hypothetical protein [Lysinibacillus sp. Bpr_S20]
MNKLILSILIVIILTGCNVFPTDTLSQPEGKVIMNGEQYKMIQSDYQWKEDNVEISTKSSADINELAELFETIEVEKDDTLKFEIDKNPTSIKVAKLNEDGTTDIVEMKDNEIKMPSESGYYIYQLITIWSKGKQTFVFDVNVE